MGPSNDNFDTLRATATVMLNRSQTWRLPRSLAAGVRAISKRSSARRTH